MSFLMVNLVSLYLLRSINNSVSVFHTQFVLDLFFLFKQFQSHFIKFFLIQKPNSSAKLNHKEGKQEEATID